MDEDVGWLRALATWIAGVAESPTESARALMIADRLEQLGSKLGGVELELDRARSKLDSIVKLARQRSDPGCGCDACDAFNAILEKANAVEKQCP